MPSTPYVPMRAFATRVMPPDPEQWAHEPKWDGYRFILHLDAEGRLCSYSRRGNAYTGQLPYIDDALRRALPPETVLDGELVGLRQHDGRIFQDRTLVHSALSGRGPHRPSEKVPALHFVAFDLIRVDGLELCQRPWQERRERLQSLLTTLPAQITLTPVGNPDAGQHQQYMQQGFEGSMFKRRDAGYRPGKTSRTWLKLKVPLEP